MVGVVKMKPLAIDLAIIYLTKEASMRPFAKDDSDRNFESSRSNAHASEAKAPGAADDPPGETNARTDRAAGARSHAPDAGKRPKVTRSNEEICALIEEAISKEMIEAGAEALDLSYDPYDGSRGLLTSHDIAMNIFIAMMQVAIPNRKPGGVK